MLLEVDADRQRRRRSTPTPSSTTTSARAARRPGPTPRASVRRHQRRVLRDRARPASPSRTRASRRRRTTGARRTTRSACSTRARTSTTIRAPAAPTTDAVAGFQNSLGAPATGRVRVGGLAHRPRAGRERRRRDRARARPGSPAARPTSSCADEVAAWQAWTHAARRPARARSRRRSRLQSQVVLRMGQVPRRAAARGRSSRASPPGSGTSRGCATWPTPSSASCAAATTPRPRPPSPSRCRRRSGSYQQYVGAPYQISVVPLLRRRHRVERLEQRRPEHRVRRVRPLSLGARPVRAGQRRHRVARAVVARREVEGRRRAGGAAGAHGLIAADSSIWEVHWDGQQKHFAYTTITAANGLCSASRLATGCG